MKTKKLIFGVMSVLLTLNVVACGTKEDNKKDSVEHNVVSNEEEITTSNESSNLNSNSNTNTDKKYITMEVTSMNDGSKTKYEVDNYAQGYGVAGLSSQYYYVKDNELFFVSAAEPEKSIKVISDAYYVLWNNDIGFIAITKSGVEIPNEYSTYLTAVYMNDEKVVTVKSMDGTSSKDYVVDNYTQGYGAAGMSNNYYYVKGAELYYVNAAEPENNKKIAVGVKYVTFSESDKINGFVAFTTKDFKYVDENSAYLLKTISLD